MPQLLREHTNTVKQPIDSLIDNIRTSKPEVRIIDVLKSQYPDSYQNERLLHNAIATLEEPRNIKQFLCEYIDKRCMEKHLLDGCRNGYLTNFKIPADEVSNLLEKHYDGPARVMWTESLNEMVGWKTYELMYGIKLRS